MSKTRVAVIVEATTGGTRRHVADLVGALEASRFAVTLFCALRRDPGFRADLARLRQAGAAVVEVPMVRRLSPARDAAALVRLVRLLRRGRFDVVHTHSSKAGFLGRLAARLAGVPTIIHTPHTFAFEMQVHTAYRTFYRFLERIAARWTSRLICVCEAEREAARRAGLDRGGRCVVIPNGLPEAAFREEADRNAIRARLGLRPEACVVGMVGRLVPQKRPLDLVDAAASVLRQTSGVQFVLVGDGPLMPAVRREVETRGLSRTVLAPGALENGGALMPALDVFVLPSRWESLPYALLEAMASGTAIVAADVGGVSEAVVHGESGLLVPPGSPSCLTLAILELLADPGKRIAFGAAARKRAYARYRLETMVARVAELYAGA